MGWDPELVNVGRKKGSLPAKVIYKNKEKTSNIDIANSFNDFFVNIGKNVEAKIPQSSSTFSSYLKTPNERSLFLKPCDQEEVLSIINSFKTSTAPGPNSIPPFILLEFVHFLLEPLTPIINMSLNEGIFPSLNKEANVCPVYKKEDKLKCENYRPISLLPNISKIFERIMYNRVEDFLIKTNQMYDLQFGFVKTFRRIMHFSV